MNAPLKGRQVLEIEGNVDVGKSKNDLWEKNAMEKHWIGNGQTLYQKNKNENKKQWIKERKRLIFLSNWKSGDKWLVQKFKEYPEVRSLILLAFPS